MRKTILTAFLLIILIISISSVSAETKNEYIVKGEDNLEKDFDVKEEFSIDNTKYYVINYSGVGTLSYNSNIYKNEEVSLHQQSKELKDYNYNINIIDGKSIPNENQYEDINVAILDTGISTEHDNLKSVKWETSIISNDPNDNNGHGTHVAGIIASSYDEDSNVRGVAPNVSIYNIKILDSTGSGSTSDMAQGIIKARNGPDGVKGTEDDADIISISAGSNAGISIGSAVEEVTPETTVIASAGNNGNIQYPAKFNESIAVSSVNQNKKPSFLNAEGEEIDVAAPGSSVLSLDEHGGFERLSGTSMAAPHISGAVALLLSKYDINSIEVKRKIENSTEDIEEEGFDEQTGHGLINIQKILNNEIPPNIDKIKPDKNKIKLGDEVNIEYSDYNKESQLYASLGENNSFVRIESPRIEINENVLERFNIDTDNNSIIPIKVSFMVETRSGFDSKSRNYNLLTKEDSDIKLKSSSIDKEVPPHSKTELNLNIVNNGLKSGNLKAAIQKGNKIIKIINTTIESGEETKIQSKILVKQEGEHRIKLISDTIKSKEFIVKSEPIEQGIIIKNIIMSPDEIEVNEKTNMEIIAENKFPSKVNFKGRISSNGNLLIRIDKDINGNKIIKINKTLQFSTTGKKEIKLYSEYIRKPRFSYVNVNKNKKEIILEDFYLKQEPIVGKEIEVISEIKNNDIEDKDINITVELGSEKKFTEDTLEKESTEEYMSTFELNTKGNKELSLQINDGNIRETKNIKVLPQVNMTILSVYDSNNTDKLPVKGNKSIIKIKLKNNYKEENLVGLVFSNNQPIHRFNENLVKEKTKIIKIPYTFTESGNTTIDIGTVSNGWVQKDITVLRNSKKVYLKDMSILNDEVFINEKMHVQIKLRNPSNNYKSIKGSLKMPWDIVKNINVTIPPQKEKIIQKEIRPNFVGKHELNFQFSNNTHEIPVRVLTN